MNGRTNKITDFYHRLHGALRDGGKATAWIGESGRHDYDQQYAVVRRVMAFLAGQTGEPVVLLCDKPFAAYGAIYGILLSGNVWVPLSPAQPSARNIDILKLTGSSSLLHDMPLSDDLAAHAQATGLRTVALEEIAQSRKPAEDTPEVALPTFDPDAWAYIMFTSGSTGTPKGVPMTHANYIPFITNALEALPFGENEIFSDYHDFAFDISIFYLFCCPLVRGAMAPVTRPGDKVLPLSFIQNTGVTVWSSVPSAIARIRQMYPEDEPATALKIMFLCGEPFNLKVLDYCQNNLHAPHIFNFYGLTETGVENFYYACRPGDSARFEPHGHVPIGTPLPGNLIALGDDKELLLAGDQITPGYLGGVGTDRFIDRDGRVWFRSGDIVEEHDGLWFCKGRLDSQVKISGYRVELMDIEVNIKRLSSVEEAVCLIVDSGHRPILIGVVQPRPGQTVAVDELRRHLGAALPTYMVPAKLIVRDHLPVNANGKIDRRALRESYAEDRWGGR